MARLTKMQPRALTIAGSDSGGGAGIQADLKTFTVLGTYGTSVITAVTAQNTREVSGVFPLTAEEVDAQLDAVLSDIGTDSVKTGMLVNGDIIKAVAERLAQHKRHRLTGNATETDDIRGDDANLDIQHAVNPDIGHDVNPGIQHVLNPGSQLRPYSLNLVVDPVMIAKSGDALLEQASVSALREHLLPMATLVTPNVPEAEVLTGLTVQSRDDMIAAGRRLLTFGVEAVLITGGHLSGSQANDVLITEDEVRWFPARKIDTPNTHGTGCTLSAAIAAGLAHGLTLVDAVQQAKEYITIAIANAPDLGTGHGPTNHLAWLERSQKNEDPSRPTGSVFQQNRLARSVLQDRLTGSVLQKQLDESVHQKRLAGSALEQRLALYVIVDGKTPLDLVERLLDAGVGSIQLRDKQISAGEQVHIARQLQRICRAKGALFFVNDHVDVALAMGADGVHIGQDDMPLKEARLLLGPHALIGVTAKTVNEAKAAAAEGADYLGVGPIYESPTKPGRSPLGTQAIKHIGEAVSLPQVGISGIMPGRAAPVIEAGAVGVAVISSVLHADDPVKAAGAIAEEVRTARNRRLKSGA